MSTFNVAAPERAAAAKRSGLRLLLIAAPGSPPGFSKVQNHSSRIKSQRPGQVRITVNVLRDAPSFNNKLLGECEIILTFCKKRLSVDGEVGPGGPDRNRLLERPDWHPLRDCCFVDGARCGYRESSCGSTDVGHAESPVWVTCTKGEKPAR